MMKCPVCGSENVTPSHLRGLEKIFRFLYPRSPYRCKECWSRFQTGPSKGPSIKIIAVIIILLIAVFVILPLDQLFRKKDDQPAITISKSIEKPDKTKADKGDKTASEDNKAAGKYEDESPRIVKNSGADSFKTDDLSEKPDKIDKTAAKPDKPVMTDKTTAKAAKGKIVKPSESDDVSDAEHEAVPQAPEPPKLKEPTVEIPKPGKTSKKTESKGKTALSKTEVKKEDKKKEVETAVKEEEKAAAPTTVTSLRKMKGIKATASENAVEILVSADGPIKAHKNFFLLKEDPAKFVVDVQGKWKYFGKAAFDVDSELISKIRVAEHNEKGFFRIVMDLKAKEGMTPVVTESAEGLVITVKK